MRLALARLTAALTTLALCVALTAAAPAGAQQTVNPFDLNNTTQSRTVTPTSTGPTNQIDDGLQTWQGVLIVLAGLLLLFGIGFAIVRDARARAPQDDAQQVAVKVRDSHSAARDAKRKLRAKEKAVRAQRKRNR